MRLGKVRKIFISGRKLLIKSDIMKRIITIVLSAAIVTVFICFTYIAAEKRHFFTDLHFYNKNYISTTTSPGKYLRKAQFSRDDLLDIQIDGKMDEDNWKRSQVINTFYTDSRLLDEDVEVSAMADRQNIYLFWKVEDSEPLTAKINKNDSALVGDDYVQVDLKPIIPDSIKYARDYYFSIAVNPNGAIWDAYFDPYNTGYFFTSWTSNTKLKSLKNKTGYYIEMSIPFDGLDIYSDPGWKWNLTFNRAKGNNDLISSSSAGITFAQNIKVRHPRMVGYYWPRSEFWPDVIPSLEGIDKPRTEAGRLKTPPKNNGKRDNVWADCEEISLVYDNKTTELLKGKTAKAHVGYDQNNIYMNLVAPDPYQAEKTGEEKDTGEGMKRQVAGLNGIYRDLSLETTESFWILFQPGTENGDAFHQDYYFMTVDNKGNKTKIRFDSQGKPDKKWNPQIESDIYKNTNNWGIELTIPLNQLNIPLECSSNWRMNIMYNIPLEDGNSVEGFSKIRAWYPTLKDEKNPDKTGTVFSFNIDYEKYIRNTFETKVKNLDSKINSLQGLNAHKTDDFNEKLTNIKKKIRSGDLQAIKNEIDILDARIGIAEEKSLYINSLELPNDGYPLNDIHFINSQQGIAVGAMGLIMKTSDGGKTWTRQKKLTDCNLTDIFFTDDKNGWIAGGRIRSAETNESMSHDERGGDGIILHTENGGDSWDIRFARRGTYLFGIFFSDQNNGWAVGEGGLLLRTSDGGRLWSHLPTTGTIKWLNGIYFFDKLNGLIVGESETVLATNDGGFTWEKINAPADRKFYGFRSFYRDITFKGNKGWIVGQNGTILSSKDKGRTWKPQATEFDDRVRELMDLRKIFFIDENKGYAVGSLGTKIMKTSDGGESWSFVHVPNNDQLTSAWFSDNEQGFVVGGRGKILKTEDNAKTWTTVSGTNSNTDLLIFTAHGDDSPIQHGFLMTYLSKIKNKDITAVHITRDTHSNEYKGEYYDRECDRSHYLMGVKTTMHFDEFDTGNSGSRSFHINLRLWKGYDEAVRHMVAAIRTYKPKVIITHDPIYGEYDKPGHKLAGRAGFMAFYDSGNPDKYADLTNLGLTPHQPEKLYTYATEAFPATYKYESILDIPLEGHGETVKEWANRALRCFQSQGIHFVRHTPLHLIESYVKVPREEKSIFDGLK